MSFGYLRDPLFLVCLVGYFVNRFGLKLLWETGFVHDHLNDLILIPFWVPILLWGLRRLGLRPHDGTPEAHEVLLPLILWAFTFEVALPLWYPTLGTRGDPWDVLSYAAGALGAAVYWRIRYGEPALDPEGRAATSRRRSTSS